MASAVEEGYYENWSDISPKIPFNLQWYSISTLTEYLHHIETGIIQNNYRLTPLLEGVRLTFTRNVRFPKATNYLCEGIGSWHIHFSLLLWALHTMQDERKLKEGRYFQGRGDAEVFALEKVNLLLKYISDQAIRRENFEEMYGLKWKAIEQPVEQQHGLLTTLKNQVEERIAIKFPRVIDVVVQLADDTIKKVTKKVIK